MDGGFDPQTCSLDAFAKLTEQTTDPTHCPLAVEIAQNIPIYNVPKLPEALTEPEARKSLLAEWATVLNSGPGVLVLRSAYEDTAVLDKVTSVYQSLIGQEKASGNGQGDHFATAGANDRLWNALPKLCAADPVLFARYFGNIAIAAVCEAWLGPHYQMTAQINVVRPGGQAQDAHRDYHLGFQTAEVAARFPKHAHLLTAALTLQGAIAHCDMPVESGPTKLLPFSQLSPEGYLTFRRAEFQAYFEAHFVQLSLQKGDAVFFNPALFHAAGENRSKGIERMANLLQVSSAFGRAMESVDSDQICRQLYPALIELAAEGASKPAELDAAIAAAAEGYAFPTNLDSDPPVGGLAPETQADLMRRALRAEMHPSAFNEALSDYTHRRRP
ncbi:MAG: phytanoyl-CoA dioxygenase family protein [Dinoroseobacter sp.]|nr:phytanoyl-CoA dioxygenase family protein [Dinoroseobacter sp.]